MSRVQITHGTATMEVEAHDTMSGPVYNARDVMEATLRALRAVGHPEYAAEMKRGLEQEGWADLS